jgi:hypothetical protein
MLTTVEAQRAALSTPVDPRFIHQNKIVKGPYTTGEYIRWKLNEIFGSDHWSHTILQGPELITLSDTAAYAQVTIRLVVQFANGEQVMHDDVGFSPFQATHGSDLKDTAPERYETVLKSAITDGVKACAEYLGICFRPLGDEKLRREVIAALPEAENRRPEGMRKSPTASPVRERSSKASATLNEFWARFHELVRAGKIQRELEKSPEIEQARNTGNWAAALDWLNQLAGEKASP